MMPAQMMNAIPHADVSTQQFLAMTMINALMTTAVHPKDVNIIL
jgi:hypothetical protein